jgi:hypothetical protein
MTTPDDWLAAGRACLEAALDYHARGWSPLCLCPPDHVGMKKHRCDSPGKTPIGVWKAYQDEAASPALIETWWREHPNANVGLCLGPVSGLIGVDVDSDDGARLLEEMSQGDIPQTLEFRTGSGGRRLLYAIPAGVRVKSAHKDDATGGRPLSLLAYGSQTVMPPSRHVSGGKYAWVPGKGPGEIELAQAPAWVLAQLEPAAPFAPPVGEGEPIKEGHRHRVLLSMAGAMRARGFGPAAILGALREENGRCVPPLDDAEVVALAGDVARRYAPGEMAGVTIRLPGAAGQTKNGKEQPPDPPSLYAHDQLLDAVFSEQRWVVEGLAPAGGLTLLGGKKKLGKSWLCLQAALAVATGQAVLGKGTYSGRVAYLCLEDGARRLQDRLRKMSAPRGLPIDWYTGFPKLDDGGLGLLGRVLERGPRLLVIDTLAAAKSGRIDENASGPMADLGNALRGLAQESGAAFVTTHHHGKAGYGDPGDDLRGSSALAAAADLNLGLYRVEDGFRLRGEGRDIEPFDFAVSFDAHGSWRWQLLGDARVVSQDDADEAVLQALAALGEADAPGVAQTVGKSEDGTRRRLNNLVAEGRVCVRLDPPQDGRKRPRTLYRLPAPDTPF